MGFDALLKRYFPAVVCLLVGVAAYLQASGMGQLVASSVSLEPSAIPSGRPGAPHAAASANPDHTTDATIILKRNAFDSATGPLDPSATFTIPAAASVEATSRDWYDDPICEGAKVLLIAASDDEAWSFASIAGADGKTVLRRTGGELGTFKVLFIGDKRDAERRRAEPLDVYDRVWMTGSSGARCQLEVGGKVVKAAPGASSATHPGGPPPGGDPGGFIGKVKAKLTKNSDTDFTVQRSAIDLILENQGELMKSVRISPEKDGIRLFGIRPDSLLATLGILNGDKLSSINGFEMSDPQKALEAYAKLRTTDSLQVSVNRNGKPTNIDFHIK